jgi:hypothetical protein
VTIERKGTAYLPLHYGKPPEKLYRKIVQLTGQICTLIGETYGTKELVSRFSDPLWFHSLSLVTGFDWNSSGTTTTTLHALKEYAEQRDLDFFVAGGKGIHMREKAEDIHKRSQFFNRSSDDGRIVKETDLMAKVDDNLLQDQFDLYIHGVIMDYSGNYALIQQGMNQKDKLARRYHWSSVNKDKIFEESRSGIGAESLGTNCMDLSSPLSRDARTSILRSIGEKPRISMENQQTLDQFMGEKVVNLAIKVPWKNIEKIYEFEPGSMEELLSIRGVGKSTIRALCYISEIITGSKPSYEDPVRYSYAVGGKDGIPKPINHEDYDNVIDFFSDLLRTTKTSFSEREAILRRLSRESLTKTGYAIKSE